MKRARVEEGFNPVYPYGADQTGVTAVPPFVAADGLQENPPGVLSLKIERPLIFSDTRALALSYGDGLEINENGALEASVKPFTASSPLEYTDNVLSLKTGSTLTVNNSILDTALVASQPLSLNNNTMSILTGNGLGVSGGQLILDLETTAPLTLLNNILSLTHQAPLYVTANSLSLNSAAPLSVTNGKLGLSLANPIYITNSKLGLRLNGSSGLRIVTNGLQVKAGWGLQIAANNDLTLRKQDPIAVYESGTNEGVLYLKRDGNMFALNSSGQLQLRVASNSGLVFSTGLQVNTGNGLQKSNGLLAVKIGNGLSFDSSGALQVDSPSQFNTLWTTLTPEANVNIKNASGTETGNNAKLTLSLTKMGPLVTAVVRVEATGAPISPITVDRATTLITFDSSGNVTNGISNFGIKSGTGIDSSSNVSKLQFMPNSTTYPPTTDNSGSSIQVDGFLDKLRTKPCPLIVVLNGESSPYAIRLTWQLNSYQNNSTSLNTSTYSFSYYSQTQE